ELPMAKMLYSSRYIPLHYFGVDVGPINDDACAAIGNGKFPHTVFEKTNILDVTLEDFAGPCSFGNINGVTWQPKPNIVTCFECVEHMEPAMLLAMLKHLKA